MIKSLVEKQHKKGKLFVEERLQLLFDNHQYTELTNYENRDGVYVCEGQVSGKRVVVAAQAGSAFQPRSKRPTAFGNR